jgi:two-component system response regulator AtoC
MLPTGETSSAAGSAGAGRNALRARGLVLIAAANLEIQHYLETVLKAYGIAVEVADDVAEAGKFLPRGHQVSVLLLDQDLGSGALRHIRSLSDRIPIVLMTADPPVESSRENDSNVIQVQKPLLPERLMRVIAPLYSQHSQNGGSSPVRPGGHHLYLASQENGLSSEMRLIAQLIAQAGRSDVPVLVQGETGVGKEMVVREIHERSRRAHMPFVNVNCAALPRELVESQLFGYERGAFTGANRSQQGLFEVANGGTIFLDEIGDMDIRLQSKLLQVLQDQEFHPLGGASAVRVDVRVMAATHRDLAVEVANKRMREDLYYRLNVISIVVPPLRERRGEILPLAEFFLRKHTQPGSEVPELGPAMKRALLAHDWPGNVRELENIIRRYIVLRDSVSFPELVFSESKPIPILRADPSSSNGQGVTVFESLDQAKRKAQTDALLAALNATRWNRKKAAELLKVDYKQLIYQMKKFRIGREDADRSTPSPISGPVQAYSS